MFYAVLVSTCVIYLLVSLIKGDYSLIMLYSSIFFINFNYHAISLSLFLFHIVLNIFLLGEEFDSIKIQIHILDF